mmetsp:Transcript_30093/g.76484  ORF Transcript_30093/g.76484 Transcript_30093/m.76484 type:complete len:454 (-) Transcript_30093:121-1482(-)
MAKLQGARGTCATSLRGWYRQERHVEIYVSCIGLLISAVFCCLDFPCDSFLDAEDFVIPTAVQLSDWLSFFRVTCVGFHVGVLGFMFLPSRGPQLACMHMAMLWNSLSYWHVASAWCFDDFTWFGLLVLEHAFQVIGVLLLFDGHWLLLHVSFTIPGAFSMLAQSHASKHARRLSDTESSSWNIEVLILVSLLVGGMIAVALLSELRQKLLARLQELLQKLRGHAVAGPPKAAAPHRGHCQCCRRVRTAPAPAVQQQAFDPVGPVVLAYPTRAGRDPSTWSSRSNMESEFGAASQRSSMHFSEVPSWNTAPTLSDLDGASDVHYVASEGSSWCASQCPSSSQNGRVFSPVEEEGKRMPCKSPRSNLDGAVEESCKKENQCDVSESMKTDPKKSSEAIASECGGPGSCEPTEAGPGMESGPCTQSTVDATQDSWTIASECAEQSEEQMSPPLLT